MPSCPGLPLLLLPDVYGIGSLRSKSEPEVFGLRVRPNIYFSPLGERGGVCICECLGECGVAILLIKIGEGGAVSYIVG